MVAITIKVTCKKTSSEIKGSYYTLFSQLARSMLPVPTTCANWDLGLLNVPHLMKDGKVWRTADDLLFYQFPHYFLNNYLHSLISDTRKLPSGWQVSTLHVPRHLDNRKFSLTFLNIKPYISVWSSLDLQMFVLF